MDPNGEEVIITGEAAAAFFKEVKKGAKEFGISVKMDKNGKLSAKYTGKGSISKEGQLFLDAVDDRTVKVNINAINNKKGTYSEFMFGGAFGGNELFGETIDGEWVNQYAVAKQTVIPSELNAMDEFYGLPGRTSLHEITEAYQGAKIAMSENIISSATGANNPLYKRAHNNAIPQSGQVFRYLYDAHDKPTNIVENARWIDWNVGAGNLQKNLKRTRIY